jgi:hypothetical protein
MITTNSPIIPMAILPSDLIWRAGFSHTDSPRPRGRTVARPTFQGAYS